MIPKTKIDKILNRNGPISNYMVSQYQRKCGNAELAIQSLENGIKIFEKMGVVPYLYLFDLSGCYAMDLNWKAAIEVLEKMVEKGKIISKFSNHFF